jgi:hypothetical protein
MISQIPPNRPRRPARATLAIRGEPELTASDLARYLESGSGAKGTRTPDPLLANNRHHVHPRPYPQGTVPGRPPGSAQIQACCGTSVLYTCKPQREGLDMHAPLVPRQRPGWAAVSVATSILTQREKHT